MFTNADGFPDLSSPRTCKRCKGEKKIHLGGYTLPDGQVVEPSSMRCVCCRGAGSFPGLDVAALLNEIAGRKGLRSKRPESDRAYYVWRMARFHGGADVTLPMMAASGVSADPYLPELDQIAEGVAKAIYGTDKAAAYRWAPLIGNPVGSAPAGLPATAYGNGPVLDGDVEKPQEEFLELR